MADTTAIADKLCSSSTIKLLSIVLIEMRRRGTEIWRQSDGMKDDEFRPFSEKHASLPYKLFLEFSLSQFAMVEVRSLLQERYPRNSLSSMNSKKGLTYRNINHV